MAADEGTSATTTTTTEEGASEQKGAATTTTEESSASSAAASATASELEKARTEAAALRRLHEKAQKELDALKKAQMSEADRLKVEHAEYKAKAEAAEKRVADTLIQTRFETVATKAGCHDPEAAFALADRSLLAVDEGGKVQGVDKAVEALKKAKPYLFGEAAPTRKTVGGGGGNPGEEIAEGGNQRMNNWIRRVAGWGE